MNPHFNERTLPPGRSPTGGMGLVNGAFHCSRYFPGMYTTRFRNDKIIGLTAHPGRCIRRLHRRDDATWNFATAADDAGERTFNPAFLNSFQHGQMMRGCALRVITEPLPATPAPPGVAGGI